MQYQERLRKEETMKRRHVYFSWLICTLILMVIHATIAPGEAVNTTIIDPLPGSTLKSTEVSFYWATASSRSGNADYYAIGVGNTQGKADIAMPDHWTDGTKYDGVDTHNLPDDGRKIWVRLAYIVNGEVKYNDYTYTSYKKPGLTLPKITSPVKDAHWCGEVKWSPTGQMKNLAVAVWKNGWIYANWEEDDGRAQVPANFEEGMVTVCLIYKDEKTGELKLADNVECKYVKCLSAQDVSSSFIFKNYIDPLPFDPCNPPSYITLQYYYSGTDGEAVKIYIYDWTASNTYRDKLEDAQKDSGYKLIKEVVGGGSYCGLGNYCIQGTVNANITWQPYKRFKFYAYAICPNGNHSLPFLVDSSGPCPSEPTPEPPSEPTPEPPPIVSPPSVWNGLDIYYIKKTNTGTGSTEVHVLDGDKNLQGWSLQTGTILHETGSDNSWSFAVGNYNGGRPDLYCIKKTKTGTGSTEVHILDGDSEYQKWVLETGTILHETGSDNSWNFAVVDYWGNGKSDICCIKKTKTGSGSTEVHILNGDNNYQSWSLQIGTILEETGSDNSGAFCTY